MQRTLVGLDGEPASTLHEGHAQAEQTTEDREGAQQLDEACREPTGYVSGLGQRHAVHEVTDGHTEEDGRDERAQEERDLPELLVAGHASGDGDGHRAEDECVQDDHDGQVEP